MDICNNIFRNNVLEKFGLPIQIDKAEGHFIFDSRGNRIADFVSQYGALPFGHCSEIRNKAISYLLRKTPTLVQPFNPPTTLELSERLCRLAGDAYEFVVFANSGAETVEASLKLAKFHTGRKKVLSAKNSFHGKTYSALSATGSVKYSEKHVVDKVNYNWVDFNCLQQLADELSTGEYAAFIVEAVQGEGGMIVADRQYLSEAQSLCKRFGTVFILDEVQTGLGRVGTMFAFQRFNIEPDVVLISKALGGGVCPIGAMIVKKACYNREFDEKHSSTFANNGFASHIANAVIDKLEKNEGAIFSSILNKEEYVVRRLDDLVTEYGEVFSYSGMGMMFSLRFADDLTYNNSALNFYQRQGILASLIAGYLYVEKNILSMPFLSAGNNAIRFEPPLDIAYEEIEKYFVAIEEVCKILRFKRYDVLMAYVINKHIGEELKQQLLCETIHDPIQEIYSERFDVPRFAFLIHTTSEQNLIDALPQAIREHYTDKEKLEIAKWMIALGRYFPAPTRVAHVEVTSKNKERSVVNGVLIFSPLSATEMMKLPRKQKQRLLASYLQVAEEEQVDIVGLGAYTSVISRSGVDVCHNKINITTGNSLTALSTAQAIRSRFGETVSRSSIVIIGARGSVGRLAFMDLSRCFGDVFLVGSRNSGVKALYTNIAECMLELIDEGFVGLDGSALERFKELVGLYKGGFNAGIDFLRENMAEAIISFTRIAQERSLSFPMLVSTDIADFAGQSDCVLSATSEGKAFIRGDIFRPGTVVFDTARPFDIDMSNCKEIEVYEGGLVSLPSAAKFGDSNMVGTPAGVNLACLSETMVLAMEGGDRSYSLGKKIPYKEALNVLDIATKHGFEFFLEEEKLTSGFQYRKQSL